MPSEKQAWLRVILRLAVNVSSMITPRLLLWKCDYCSGSVGGLVRHALLVFFSDLGPVLLLHGRVQCAVELVFGEFYEGLFSWAVQGISLTVTVLLNLRLHKLGAFSDSALLARGYGRLGTCRTVLWLPRSDGCSYRYPFPSRYGVRNNNWIVFKWRGYHFLFQAYVPA